MPALNLYSKNQTQFYSFLDDPKPDHLDILSSALVSNDSGAEFETRPQWHGKTQEWVNIHVRKSDWYSDLNEQEMLAWQHSIHQLLNLPEFDVTIDEPELEIGIVSFSIFEFTAEYYRQQKLGLITDLQPFRLHELPDCVAAKEPYDRFFWPDHALLTSNQCKQLIEELACYADMVMALESLDINLRIDLKTYREDSILDCREFVKFLSWTVENDLMWYGTHDY